LFSVNKILISRRMSITPEEVTVTGLQDHQVISP
jgi:hypothetical protein